MLTFRANAKINLTLDITGRRADGYHLLSMVMQSVSLCDLLTAELTGTGSTTLVCSQPGVPTDGRNLILKAAAAFYDAAKLSPSGVSFSLIKRIPSEAGLAGGSADAACALRALNRLFGFPLSEEALLSVGLSVGADLPFCLTGGTMLVEGIGEKLTVLPAMPDCTIVLAKPPVGSSTAEAYRRADSVPFPHPRPDGVIAALNNGSLSALAAGMGNSFETILSLPEVNALHSQLLAAGALGCAMTGSGSAVCALFDSESRAQMCVPALRESNCAVFLCRPVKSGCELTE